MPTSKTHGLWKRPEYTVWLNMLARCENKKCPIYSYYGGRGIKVCKSWHQFKKFYSDMGQRPEGRQREWSIERVNNNKGYKKSNCIWATMKEQNNNKRSVRDYD